MAAPRHLAGPAQGRHARPTLGAVPGSRHRAYRRTRMALFGVLAMLITVIVMVLEDPGPLAGDPAGLATEATALFDPLLPDRAGWWTVGILALTTFGLNFTFWGSMGLLRWSVEQGSPQGPGGPGPRAGISRSELAVVMAAHNEEKVIHDALTSVLRQVPASQIFVASDDSSDRTADIVRAAGVEVLELYPNVGKAGALRAALERFGILDRFGAVLFLDADSSLEPGYVTHVLAELSDPEVAVVAGYVHCEWRPEELTWLGRFLVGHRIRVYAMTQVMQKLGQAWRFFNVVYIAPGFASVYRTDVLRSIRIDPPGLVIEDFNMTFEVHRRHLGRIVCSSRAAAWSQDPDTLHDYVRQVRRWTLGFWQTVRLHGTWLSRFWVALAAWLAELLFASVVLVLVAIGMLLLLLVWVLGQLAPDWGVLAAVQQGVSDWVTLPAVFTGMLIPDYLITCWIAIRMRRPQLLIVGLAFPLMRVLDAVVGLATIPRAWGEPSTGAWKSPARR